MFVLCVNGENETSKLLHFWPKRVESRSYVDRFCIWVQNVARKVATVVGQNIFPGFDTGSWHPCDSCLLPIGLSENCFSVSFVQERLVLLEPAVAKHTDWLNNVQVARLVMGCHECIRACLGMFVHFFPVQLETFIRRWKVVTWSRPRTKILPAASRGQWLTQHNFSWLLVRLLGFKSRPSIGESHLKLIEAD